MTAQDEAQRQIFDSWGSLLKSTRWAKQPCAENLNARCSLLME